MTLIFRVPPLEDRDCVISTVYSPKKIQKNIKNLGSHVTVK